MARSDQASLNAPDPCPNDREILDLLDNRLSASATAVIWGHLDRCAECRLLTGELATSRAQEGHDAPPAGPPSRPPEAEAWTPPQQLDEYRILRRIGQGQMGRVYLARDTCLGRDVAIKFILAATATAEERARFMTEARALARISHPHVVAVYRSGEVEGRPYLVSEFVHGRSLAEVPPPLPGAEILRIGLAVARGLHEAHRRGVLHRDVKPANVMMTADGTIKLVDFGLAKLVPDGEVVPAGLTSSQEFGPPPVQTRPGTALGTPRYMAPEQWRGEAATARCDVYSLGTMLYEMASGRPPHTADDVLALATVVLTRDAQPLHALAPDLDRRVAAIIDRCLRRDPEERFAAAGELAQALEGLSAATRDTGAQEVPAGEMIGRRIGKYRVVREVGSGGMGAVYEAIHEVLGGRVAVKVLHPDISRQSKAAARFFAEARAASKVEHPGLARTHDFGQLPDGTIYILMEFLSGESLRTRLERLRGQGARLDLPRALRIARQMASALAAVHATGVMHRDLKPDNVLLVPDPDLGERVKVVDFGIAKITDDEERHTSTGAMIGTPLYMSPEQCRGGATPVSDRTDVYSLGVMLYEMITGRVPYTGSAVQVLTQHLFTPPPPPRHHGPEIPPEIETLVLEMMAKEPSQRPAMIEVAERIDGLLGTRRPGEAAPRGTGPSPRPAGRARRVWLAAALLAAGVAAGALVARSRQHRAAPAPAPPAPIMPAPPPASTGPAAAEPVPAPPRPAQPPAPQAAGKPTAPRVVPKKRPPVKSTSPAKEPQKEPHDDGRFEE